jgi:hypothetical protein
MLFFSPFSVQSLGICSIKKSEALSWSLTTRLRPFLLQVRQAMAASNGSPVEAASIPLEEVAAAVEASGFSSALNQMAAATLSSSVSIF